MIVLFHVFYVFGQYIYRNYRNKRLRASYRRYNDATMKTEESDEDMRNDILHKVIKFNPPAYVQRYHAVWDILKHQYNGKIRKVVDFGCAEMKFVLYLKHLEGIEKILCVDTDKLVLEGYKRRAQPFIAEYLNPRKTPLKIELYEGSVTYNDRKLEQTDAVICIELIEHMYEDELMDLPFNIFGYIQPKVAIITTPNADFNVLFPNFSGTRHPDHKFEWTREQFQDWAQNIVVRYPSYSVTFHGICKGPKGTEKLGACTQMAVFHQISSIEECNKIIGRDNMFKLVDEYDYPIYDDRRSNNEKVLHEAIRYITTMFYNQEDRDEGIVLCDVLAHLYKQNYSITLDELTKILRESNWAIKDRENGPIVLVECSDTEDEDEIFDMDSTDEENEISEFSDGNEHLLENLHTENWIEEASIVIPANHSFIQENSYLFDGDKLELEYTLPENTHITDDDDVTGHAKISSITEPLTYTKPEFSSASTCMSLNEIEMNDRVERLNADTQSFDTPIKSNISLALNNLAGDNTVIESTLSQIKDINLITAESQKTTNFQPYMSVSISSTSPPFVLCSEMDISLDNWNASFQSELNDTFCQSEVTNEPATNVEKFTTENKLSLPLKRSFPEKDCIQISEINSTASASKSKINNSCNLEQVTSVKDQAYENNDCGIIKHTGMISSNNFSSPNKQPKFTSSPKVSTKTFTNNIEESDSKLKKSYACKNILLGVTELSTKNRSDINSSSSKDISHKFNSTTTVETFQLCVDSLSDNIINTSKCNVGLHLVSNNTQQHLCLEKEEFSKIVESSRDPEAEKSDVINRESDITDDVQNVDAHHSSSLNNENINDKEEDVYCTSIKTDDYDRTMKAHQEDVINDSAQLNVRKKSLSPPKKLSSFKSQNNSECSSTECAKKTSILETDRLIISNNASSSSSSNKDTANVQFASVLKKDDEIVGTSKDVNTSNIVGSANNIEAKSASPFETPPNSWSPEIMDSGYPNSASVQDITPEYDLSSIAQDHIPDSESPSIAEAPRLGILEPIEVENGDLANNNRDDEGNNMMAVDADDIENLQPLIDVLENDLENENDIYVMQNGFPIWLLRLLDNPLDFDIQPQQNLREREDEVAGDADYVGRDEGFDGNSSGNESDT